MSQENVELHRRGYDAWNRRDLDAWLAVGDHDIEFVPYNVALEGGQPYRSHDGARRYWRDFIDAFPDLRVEVEWIRGVGDVTLAQVRLVGHGAGIDTLAEGHVWHAMRWRAGKCVWWASEYADLGERVLAWGTIHVRGKGSGVETDIETGGIFELRDGKIARWEDFGSKENALAAAGVPERGSPSE